MNKALSSCVANFSKNGNDLVVGGRTVQEIVAESRTPAYIYDLSLLRRRHGLLRKNLPAELRIDYAVKANPNVKMLRELGTLYDGFDVASAGEIARAMEAGVAPGRMSFAGPGKSNEELTRSVMLGIGSISIESEQEIARLSRICTDLNKSVNVLIRINPHFELSKSGLKMGGGAKQFGVDSERLPALLHKYCDDQRVHIRGVHIYAGSQNLSGDDIIATFEKIIAYAIELTRTTAIEMDILNLGGGFGIPYFAMDDELDIEAVGAGIISLLEKYRKSLPHTLFKIELGRYLIGPCGIYAAKVLYRKISRDQVFIIIDGGMHQHLAASGNMGQRLVHRPMPMTIATAMDKPLEKVNVVGPLCTPLDTFGMNVELPHAEEGDILVVFNSGAYGFSASPLRFLSHEEPGEIIV
ncbi:pyridoxal-dependent decarboxylase, exosortase A system-associated [candidate division KSB1 bacterium]|nr:pyridoxal-dependent decarboxylase, exosortase A system-associated [candidate division KSB1 bacterium]